MLFLPTLSGFGAKTIDPDAQAWFTAMESAGATFASGAKDAYNAFFVSEAANGNLAKFNNGMLLAYAGFTGLNGCFVPLRSRGGQLPINVGFVAGQHNSTGLQGNTSSTIDCVISFLPGQLDNHSVVSYGSTLQTTTDGTDVNAEGGGKIQIGEQVAGGAYLRSSTASVGALGLTKSTGYRGFVRTVGASLTYYTSSSSSTVTLSSDAASTTPVLLFGRPTGLKSNRKMQLLGWGDALPDPASFRAATNTLMAALGIAI
jgi:hypothetical protein